MDPAVAALDIAKAGVILAIALQIPQASFPVAFAAASKPLARTYFRPYSFFAGSSLV